MFVLKLIKVLAVASGFVVFYLGGALLGWIVLPLVRLGSATAEIGRKRCQHIVAGGCRMMMWYVDWTHAIRPSRAGQPGPKLGSIDVDGPAIVIANHPSLLDAVLLVGCLGEGVVVVKSWVYFNPCWGLLSWCCGYIRSGEGVGRGMAVIREATERVSEGDVVIFFPEGTRSPRGPAGRLWEFKRGAFQIAALTDTPIAPIRVVCRPPVLGKWQSLWDFPARHRVELQAQPLWDGAPTRRVLDARKAARRMEAEYRVLLDA